MISQSEKLRRSVSLRSIASNASNDMRRIFRRWIRPEILGALDYYRFPERRDSWGGPFNNQVERRKIVDALIDALKPKLIVETGTFRGTSTRYFATNAQCPIITIEANPRTYGFARVNLLKFRNVRLLKGDSRAEIKKLSSRKEITSEPTLFYLDAHWGDELPLAEELDLIFSNWQMAVAIVDDFQVPDDSGYCFDDYGPGKSLTLSYIADISTRHKLSVFFPASRSTSETGSRRGCVCLTADSELSNRLSSISKLRIFLA